MTIAVLAADAAFEELTAGAQSIEWLRCADWDVFSTTPADCFVNLEENAADRDYHRFGKTVIIHAVLHSLSEKQLPDHVIRINAWAGFLARPVWEYAGEKQASAEIMASSIGKKLVMVPDEPGFVAARTISMIINEAYFALGEKVSSKKDIDTAMRLGVNYPFGPFEWAEKIGVAKVCSLLRKLAITDNRYTAAESLAREAGQS